MFRNLSTDALGFWAPQNEQIELAMSFGFKSIDIDIADFTEQVQSRGPEKARRLIDSAKIKVGAFTLPIDLEADDAAYKAKIALLAPWAQLAGELECQRALISVSPASDTRPMKENFDLHRTRLTEIAGVLAARQISLGVGFNGQAHARQGKTHEFISDFEKLSTLVKTVSRENVGLIVDIWQLHAAGAGVDEVRGLSPDRIVYVRLADAPPDVARDEFRDEHRLLPGAGGIDLVGLITTLNEMQYAGPITPMLFFGQFHGRRRDQAIRQIAQAMDEVWKGAGLPPALVSRVYGSPIPAPVVKEIEAAIVAAVEAEAEAEEVAPTA